MAPNTAVTNSKDGSGTPVSPAEGPIPSSPRNFDTNPARPVVTDCGAGSTDASSVSTTVVASGAACCRSAVTVDRAAVAG